MSAPTVTRRQPAPGDRSYRRGMAVSGVAFAMIFVLGGGAVLSSLWLSQDVSTAQDSPGFDGVRQLRLTVDSATVKVTAGTATRTTVGDQLRWSPRTTGKPSVRSHLDGGTLTVDARGCGVSFGFNVCDVALNVAVPRGVPVNVQVDSGDTTVTGPTGALRVKGDSGGLTVRNATAPVDADLNSGDVVIDHSTSSAQLHTDSGGVTVSGLAGDLTADVNSGSVSATGLTGQHVKLSADSGEQLLDFDAAPASVVTKDDSGSTTIRLPHDAGAYAVSAHTDSGANTIGVRQDPSATRRIQSSNDSGDITVSYK